MKYLTFALAKGRLAKKSLALFEQIGISMDEMKDPDTRKLIFVNEELGLKFFLAKGPDVPTYVEYGAADIGVVGKDTIIEEGRKVHEVLDLGFGKCRMCVCGYEEAAEKLKHHELIRVATKYPNIRAGFIHVPFACEQVVGKASTMASMPLETIAKSLEYCIEAVVTNKEEVEEAMGTTH